MNIYVFLTVASVSAGAPVAEESDPRDTLGAAIRGLSEQSGYSWRTTSDAPRESRFRRGPAEGRTRDGLIHVTTSSRDRQFQVVIRGDRAAATNLDGEWEPLSLKENGTRSGSRFVSSMARGVRTPAVEAAELLSAAAGLRRDGSVYVGDLSEEGARERLSLGRRDAEATVRDATVAVRFWLQDGMLAKYELTVRGTIRSADGDADGERRLDRTTTVEIFDVGATVMNIPEDALTTLRAPLPAPPPELRPEVARAVLERNGKRDAGVHDPSAIVECKDEYWFFSTGSGVSSWRSRDLATWERGPRVFPEIPGWVREVVPTQRGHFWAPDVLHHGGRYLVYYSVSRFGVNTSAIALASNPTLDPADPEYAWTDHGVVIRSSRSDDFNAIDPAVIRTSSGALWMSFGSYWSGIKLIELDVGTGKRIAPDSPMHSLAHYRAIEAPHIHEHSGLYYLFVNWDRCCRGADSTYNIRVGRSAEVTGPYLDQAGVDLMDGGGSLLLGTDGPFIGPGHANILEEAGRFWFSCHYYDGTERGRSMLCIRPLVWGDDGWPRLPPVE